LIGHVDVKATPVYFYAQKTKSFVTLNAVVPFELLRLNVGNAMNTNGIFVAPTPGKYLFTSSGVSEYKNVRVELQLKTETVDWTKVTQGIGHGDQIRLIFLEGTLHDGGNHYTSFVGQLLEEDLLL
jgi:hypothetical protein